MFGDSTPPLATEEAFILITGGGTAGHVYPALAVGRALVDRGHSRSAIHFAGTKRGLESQLVPKWGFKLTTFPGRGLSRSLTIGNVLAVVELSIGVLLGVWRLGKRRPSVVISLGGYAAFPSAMASVLLGVPLVIVNTDAVPGATNRLLGRFAIASAVAFDNTSLPRAVVTGTPVRPEVAAVDTSPTGRHNARACLGIPDDRLLIAAFGGSLGSRRINYAVIGMVKRWIDRSDLAVYQVVGKRDWTEVQAGLPKPERTGIFYRAVEYEERMPEVLAASDLVVSRAGAASVAELAVVGRPVILVPLPGAPGDHQAANAAKLADAGAAVLVPDAECTPERLVAEVAGLAGDAERRVRMAAAAAVMGRADAAARVASLVDSCAGASRRSRRRRTSRQTITRQSGSLGASR